MQATTSSVFPLALAVKIPVRCVLFIKKSASEMVGATITCHVLLFATVKILRFFFEKKCMLMVCFLMGSKIKRLGVKRRLPSNFNMHGALVLHCTLQLSKLKKATNPEVVVIAVYVVTYSSTSLW
jgi:hypothetical protein